MTKDKMLIEDLKEILNCKKDTELANVLGVRNPIISRWKIHTGQLTKKLFKIIILQDQFLTKKQKELFTNLVKK